MMTTRNTHHARPQRHAVPAPIVRLAARVAVVAPEAAALTTLFVTALLTLALSSVR